MSGNPFQTPENTPTKKPRTECPHAPQRNVPPAEPVVHRNEEQGTGGLEGFPARWVSNGPTPEKVPGVPPAAYPVPTGFVPTNLMAVLATMATDAQRGDGGHFGDTHAEPPSPADTVIVESQMVEMPAYFPESPVTDKDDVNDDGYLTADVSDGGYTVRPRTGNVWSDDRLDRFYQGRKDQGKPVLHRAADLPASASTSLYNSLRSSVEAGSDGDDEEEDGVDQFLPSNADVPRTP